MSEELEVRSEELKVTSEELCKALRCSTTPFEKCTGCPYDSTESLEDVKERFPDDNIIPPEADCDGMYHFCDVERISLDAAERIEGLNARLDKAVELLKAKFLAADLCSVCKHGVESDFLDFCTDCCGDRFEWKE